MDEKALAWAIKILNSDDRFDDITFCTHCPYENECEWAGCVVDEAIEWAERVLKE